MARISAKRTITTSFVVDLIDIILNVVVMVITGSVVLLAEALEGASDLLASGLLWIGLKHSKKRTDRRHPFGYGKALFSWTLISAMVMLIFAASLSFYFGLKRFIEPKEIEQIGLAFVALLISVVTNGYALTVSTRRLLHDQPLKMLWKEMKHSTHVETKNTFILDLTGTSAALVGLLSLAAYQFLSIESFDAIGGMLMGVVIAVFSVLLIYGVKDFLAGKGAPPDIHRRIKSIVLGNENVKDVTEINTMYVGSERLLLHLDIRLSAEMTAKAIELTTDEIKNELQTSIPELKQIQIEIHT